MNTRVQVIVETPEAIRGIVFQNQHAGYVSLYVYPYQREKSMTKPLLLYRRLQLSSTNHGVNELEKWHFIKVNAAILRERSFLDLDDSKVVIEIRAGQLSPQYPAFGIRTAFPVLKPPLSEPQEDGSSPITTLEGRLNQLAAQIESLATLRQYRRARRDNCS